MAKSKKKIKRKSRPIVIGHLEKISRRIFDQNRKQIAEIIEGHQGIYALYRKEKLYYVGLATDLRRRISWHLRDKHKSKWTHFSLYILRRDEHLREVEALVLRIADPTGNYAKGKLKGSKDLRRSLKALLRKDFKKFIDDLLGVGEPTKKERKRRKAKVRAKATERPLRGKFPGGKVIYAKYKGKEYKAWVRTNGGIRLKGETYDTPSAAGMAIVKRSTCNGWNFWKYKNKSGDLVAIKDLR
ncbi:hypothetical protein ES703_124084 [subsurface metagenome]